MNPTLNRSRSLAPLRCAVAALLITACQKSTSPGDATLPGDPMELYHLGSEALQKNDPQRAVEYLQSAVRRQPDFQEAQVLLGRAAYLTGNLGLAVRSYADALLLSTSLPVPGYSQADIHYNLGIVYEQTQQLELALEHYLNAAHFDPEFSRAWLRAAALQKKADQASDARESLEAALEADSTLAEAHWLEAQLAMDAGDRASAEKSLRRAGLYDAKLAEPRLALARLLAEENRPADALAPLLEYMTLEPKDEAARKLLVAVYQGLGLPDLAHQAMAHSG